jgi:hypothetical protein
MAGSSFHNESHLCGKQANPLHSLQLKDHLLRSDRVRLLMRLQLCAHVYTRRVLLTVGAGVHVRSSKLQSNRRAGIGPSSLDSVLLYHI